MNSRLSFALGLCCSLVLLSAEAARAQISPARGKISIEINGEHLEGSTRAVCNLTSGELYLTTTLSSPPTTFNSLLAFEPTLLTGQPRCSRPLKGARNPFRDASQIAFRRIVTFDSGERFIADITYNIDRGQVDATYKLAGTVPNVAVGAAAEPTVELWTPGDKANSMNGTFRMCWQVVSGKLLCGTAVSEYSYKPLSKASSTPAAFPQHRFITLKGRLNGSQYEQWERITLFRNLPGHPSSFESVEALASQTP